MATANDGQQTVNAVFNMPPYTKACPKLYFIQCEHLFSAHRITNSKKRFEHVITALPSEVLMEVIDVIESPPAQDPYETLKHTVLERLAISEEDRISRLLHTEHMGDSKPTQFLRRLQSLRGSDMSLDNKIIRHLFIDRLPDVARQSLASLPPDMPLSALAQVADNVLSIMGSGAPVAAISASDTTITAVPQPSAASPTDLQQIIKRLDTLLTHQETTDRRLNKLESLLQPSSRNDRSSATRGRSPSPHRPIPTRPTQRTQDEICWYHEVFQERAHKCKAPCKWDSTSTSPDTQKNA